MLDRILNSFPQNGPPLTVASDPDDLLAGDELLAALYARDYTLLEEVDPVRLRRRLSEFSKTRPGDKLILAVPGAANEAPYDLWQQATRVNLSLPEFFPNLAYPVLRALSPAQRARLTRFPAPPRLLGLRDSADYILDRLFGVDLDGWQDAANFIEWLDALHGSAVDPLPARFVERLRQRLSEHQATDPHYPDYASWPLPSLFTQPAAFRRFLDNQWRRYIARHVGDEHYTISDRDRNLSESTTHYVLDFGHNQRLQDTLPRLLRSGSLSRVELDNPQQLPSWARAAVLAPDEDAMAQRVADILALLAQHAKNLHEATWSQWQHVARAWAAFSNLALDPTRADTRRDVQQAYDEWQARLDAAFLSWLTERYAPLGARPLPTPHHVFHIPEYLAQTRAQNNHCPLALIILDGMAFADWAFIRRQWQIRRPHWHYDERLLMAQIPSITPISRQALVSGERPAAFASRLTDTSREAQHWQSFWTRENVPPGAALYTRLRLHTDGAPTELGSPRLQVACLVNNSIDDITHGAHLGGSDVLASLSLWLDERSRFLEQTINNLLARDFLVFLTSDHGHVQATGMGSPREGQVAETRGMRARIYRNAALAEEVQAQFPNSIIWHGDGLLPADTWVLMPRDRRAFTTGRHTVVTHGGLTLEEMIVPLVQISQRS